LEAKKEPVKIKTPIKKEVVDLDSLKPAEAKMIEWMKGQSPEVIGKLMVSNFIIF
jgi:hypothetical protein